ncbi:MAG: PEP-CTERM sorting domain-containing protein [Verrucomicrobiales bacterium]
MSTSDEQLPDEAPIPEAASAALRQRGDHLLSELESMRRDEGSRPVIEPLDPQAELALRRGGDELLATLDSQRAELATASATGQRRWNWRHSSAAAALIALATAIILNLPSASPPPAKPVVTKLPVSTTVGDQWSVEPIASPAIPEPSSALLALLGGVILLGRRRRPAQA